MENAQSFQEHLEGTIHARAESRTQVAWEIGGKVLLLYDSRAHQSVDKALSRSCAKALAAFMAQGADATDRVVRMARAGEKFNNSALLGKRAGAGKVVSEEAMRAANDQALRRVYDAGRKGV